MFPVAKPIPGLLLLVLLISFFTNCNNANPKKNVPEEKKWQPKGVFSSTVSDWGSRKEITLKDGTKITMGSATTVKISDSFNIQSRKVIVDGDALFEIFPDSTKPFLIYSKHLLITPTNGIFRVTAYGDSEGETVLMQRGQLKAEKSYPSKFNEPEYLKGGDMVMINQSIDLMEKETFDSTEVITWKKGVLAVNKMPLNEVARKLEDWYGVSITLNGDYSKFPVMTSSIDNKSLKEVLDNFHQLFHIQYKIEKNKVTINF